MSSEGEDSCVMCDWTSGEGAASGLGRLRGSHPAEKGGGGSGGFLVRESRFMGLSLLLTLKSTPAVAGGRFWSSKEAIDGRIADGEDQDRVLG